MRLLGGPGSSDDLAVKGFKEGATTPQDAER